MQSDEPVQLRNPPLAAFLAWLVPGLGHVYQGRTGKGILFFFCIYGLFFFGLQQGAWRIVYFRWDEEEWRYPYLAQVGVGLAALPALIEKPEWRTWLPRSLATFEARPYRREELDALTQTYQVRHAIEAERVNALAEQHGIGLVSELEHDELHRKYGKRMDIALVYTMIAGLLNILVIYDALAGPAMADEEKRMLEPASPRGATR